MNYNQNNKIHNNECDFMGICSISPSLAFLHELIKLYIKELSFYLLKLKEFGITNNDIKEHIINAISGILVGVNYKEDEFIKIIQKFCLDLKQAKNLYTSLCVKNNIKPEFIKSKLKMIKKINLSEAIRQGEKIATTKEIQFNKEQKTLFDLMYYIIKSICVHFIELKDLGFEDEEHYFELLKLFSAKLSGADCAEKIHKIMEDAVKLDHHLLLVLQEKREERYGNISPTEISRSTRANKAILVSGTNIKELELILEATKDKKIDVYTHGRMIIAHAFPKFKTYPHLAGHFGTEPETYLLDFTKFPGPIFMTRHSFQKIEGLYRSRIFTSDVLAPAGVMIIKDNNYEPLIQSALSSNGFTKSVEYPAFNFNVDETKILKEIKNIAQKIQTGEIKHFFAIEGSNRTKAQKEYFEKFLNLLKEDSFVLSFSYTTSKENILCIESDCGFPILYKSLEILIEKIGLSDLNPIVLYARCEAHTISNVLYMKYLGINKIYFTDCPPGLINPSLVDAMREMFNIKKYTNPEADLENMLKE
jgi:hydroxylamine reductase